jgi:hypothetical protein
MISKDVDFAKLPVRAEQDHSGKVVASSRDYAKGLIASHSGEKELVNIQALSEEYLSQQKFSELLASGLGRELSAEEIRGLTDFFVVNSPLKLRSVQERLDSAISAKGRDRHLRFYLEQVCSNRARR